MLHEYHVIYSVQYYPQFHVTVVGLGTYYPWLRGHYCRRYSRLYSSYNYLVSVLCVQNTEHRDTSDTSYRVFRKLITVGTDHGMENSGSSC
jgi:hypothetical protein